MGRFERVIAALGALPVDRREEIAELLQHIFSADLFPENALSHEQVEDLKRRVANPGPIARAEEVERVLSRFR